jgi:hypothetical protein
LLFLIFHLFIFNFQLGIEACHSQEKEGLNKILDFDIILNDDRGI